MKLSNGREASTDEGIISLMTFNFEMKMWECIGTGFFIHPEGFFVTARHVMEHAKQMVTPTLYGVQTLPDDDHDLRVVRFWELSPNADIAIGFLGEKVIGKKRVEPQPSIPFQLNFNPLSEGDRIRTYAYPETKSEEVKDGTQEFTFQGRWSEGEILEYCPNGRGKVENRCYMTSMDIRGGASGGPVIWNNKVIGINSSGMYGVYSLVTPIDLIADLRIPTTNGIITMEDMIRSGHISVERT